MLHYVLHVVLCMVHSGMHLVLCSLCWLMLCMLCSVCRHMLRVLCCVMYVVWSFVCCVMLCMVCYLVYGILSYVKFCYVVLCRVVLCMHACTYVNPIISQLGKAATIMKSMHLANWLSLADHLFTQSSWAGSFMPRSVCYMHALYSKTHAAVLYIKICVHKCAKYGKKSFSTFKYVHLHTKIMQHRHTWIFIYIYIYV